MARKKNPYLLMLSVGADVKSAPDAVINVDVNYENRLVTLSIFRRKEEAVSASRRTADNRAFLTHEGLGVIVDELKGVEVYGRYLNGEETVKYVRSCTAALDDDALMDRAKNLVSTIGHKGLAVDREILAGAARKALKHITHDISAFRMLGLMAELPDIIEFGFVWGN